MVNASKPIGALNRPAGSGAMLAWYQDKPIGVLNRSAGSGEILVKIDLVKRAFKEDSGEGVQLRSLVLLGTVRPKARSIRRNDYR